ncbi:MAG: hypothetical protein K8S00_00505 [Bacteroidales bacterium]|nr:hypothetical protein [Bacteroidales bacterium]
MLRYNKTYRILTISAMVVVGLLYSYDNAYGQTYDEEITVIAPYEPSISDAFKININPKIKDTTTRIIEHNYSILPKRYDTKFQLEPIKPAKIVGEPIDKLYKNFVKAGFGNYTTPYVEFFANKLRSKTQSFGVHLKHISTSGKIDDYDNSNSSNNFINLFAKKYNKKNMLGGEIFYDRNVVHYYGLRPGIVDNIVSKHDKKRYSKVGANLFLKSTNIKKDKLNYAIDLDYYNLSDNYKSSENNIDFTGSIDKNVKLFKKVENQKLGIITNVNFFNNKLDTLNSSNNALIKFKPFIELGFDEYNIHFGVDASIKADTSSAIYLYPNAKISINIIKDMLTAFVGVSGEINKNSYDALSAENPFIISEIPLQYTEDKFNFSGGITSSPGKYVDVTASITNSNIDNMHFFINDTTNFFGNTFTLLFDDVSILKVSAECSYQKKERFSLLLRANYYSYNMDLESKPWHKPEYDIYLSAMYSIQKKIIVKTDIFAFGKSFAKEYENGIELAKELNAFIDLNLGVEYRYTKILSAFLNINNLTSNRYFRWNNYPSQKFNFMAGISYSF